MPVSDLIIEVEPRIDALAGELARGISSLEAEIGGWLRGLVDGEDPGAHRERCVELGRLACELGLPQQRILEVVGAVRLELLGAIAGRDLEDHQRLAGRLDGDLAAMLDGHRARAESVWRADRLAILAGLAAGLAHEIRNPLNAARLQLELASRRVNGNARRALESLARVSDELGRLEHLVDDFLTYARPSPLTPGPCDLSEIAEQVVGLLERSAAERGVSLRAVADGPVELSGDERQLRQLVYNLVDNGIDAASPGGRVEVAVTSAGARVVVTVSDTGPGVPEDLDIFAPFVTSKELGVGLGLSIVERVVIDHRGELAVDRRDGRTVFAVELPAL